MVFIAPGIALAVFVVLFFVCWSYRDVYNRQNVRQGANAPHDAHEPHDAGH